LPIGFAMARLKPPNDTIPVDAPCEGLPIGFAMAIETLAARCVGCVLQSLRLADRLRDGAIETMSRRSCVVDGWGRLADRLRDGAIETVWARPLV